MLDKSVPYVDVLMRRPQGVKPPPALLPPGFRFSYFQPGDEKAWAKIEASVLEFPDEIDALLHFQRWYMPHISELERRCIFVETEHGEKVATCTAWWCYTDVRRDPWLHWLAVNPEYQGCGLGKAIAAKTIQLMLDIEGDRDFYLHTQTWSHKAIKIYESLGYRITDERNLAQYSNENYLKAIEILENIYKHKINAPL